MTILYKLSLPGFASVPLLHLFRFLRFFICLFVCLFCFCFVSVKNIFYSVACFCQLQHNYNLLLLKAWEYVKLVITIASFTEIHNSCNKQRIRKNLVHPYQVLGFYCSRFLLFFSTSWDCCMGLGVGCLPYPSQAMDMAPFSALP